ncbi:O-antigen ligase family protein [Luteimonas sp. MC1782]|uniref:O-antigen ligase family protein n=1 Tax=Luteimonas sp. MC1782 TaxID=2760305 RepID=UPI00160136E4|nr:O-antigen ligase family protein [Luteimonas sp. MC1782]MBB1472243.1 O-antigen ligase family protein [Luteimonas sp. MC1782]
MAAVVALLVLSLVAGGSSQESAGGVFAARLLALPLIAWGGWLLLRQGAADATHRAGAVQWAWLLFLAALVAIPLLQLWLPGAMAGGEGRAALGHDLQRFGAEAPAHWSLAPAATRDAGFALMPALAVFALTLALPTQAQRRLAVVVVLMAVASLLLGIAQLGAPQESALNPYPQWQPAMNGFFANPNHQATLLVVAATLGCARLATAVGRWPTGRPHRAATIAVAALVMLLTIVALPLTGSRAGVVLFILACGVVVAAHWPAWRGSRRGRVMLAASLALAGVGLLAALRWMQVDTVDELRAPLRAVTGEIAARFAPAGTGLGSYVPVFEQEAPREMLMGEYINHAHNEYAQWWLTAGVPALVAMVLGTVALALTVRGLWRLPADARGLGVTALVALAAILAHSIVDYPLRTPAMLAVAAALAGIAAAQAAREGRGRDPHRLPVKTG